MGKKTINHLSKEVRERFGKRAKELAAQGMTASQAVEILAHDFPEAKITYYTLTNLAKKDRLSFSGLATRPEVSDDELQLRELRSALVRSRRSLVRAKAKSEDLVSAVYRASYDASLTLGAVPPVSSVERTAGPGKEEVALLHATDWQYGKLTETYSMERCRERVEQIGDKVELLTNIQRAEHPVNVIHLMLGGDMLEGLNIFPGQAYEVEADLFDQLFGVANIMKTLVRRLESIFEVVEVWQEEGNHGRLGKKGDWPRTDNTDLMAYEITRQAFVDDPRVIWHPRYSWYQIVEIGNYRAMLIHGDEIKSFGGNTPAFGLLRKGTAWSSGVTEPFQDIYFGHFHTHMSLTLPNGGRMFGTGSTESDSVYAAEFVAAKGKPSQRLHYINPRRGRVTAEYKVYLDDDEG